jgi:hypothetical protein
MKEPKRPPYFSTHVPQQPSDTVDKNTTIDRFEVETYCSYTIDNFIELIKKHSSNIDPKDVRMDFSIDEGYDGHSIEVELYTISQIPNPNFDVLIKKYEVDIKKYNADKKKHNKEMAIYEVELDKWMLEQSKLNVKRLEAKIKKQEKVK